MLSLRSKIIVGVVLALIAVAGYYKLRFSSSEVKLAQSQLDLGQAQDERDNVKDVMEDVKVQKAQDEQTVSEVTDHRLKVNTESTIISERVKHEAKAIRESAPASVQAPTATDDAVSRIVLDGMWDTYQNSLSRSGAGTSR